MTEAILRIGALSAPFKRLGGELAGRWDRLAPRDQRALRVGAWLIVSLLVLGVVLIRWETHQARAQRVADKERQLLQLQQGATSASGLSTRTRDAQALSLVLQDAIRASGLSAEPMQRDDQAWQLILQDVPLSQIIELERDLSRRGVAVTRYRLDRGTADGLINAQLEWRVSPP